LKLGEHPKIEGPLFLQPLNRTTTNLVHNLGSDSSLPKTTFMTKIVGGLDPNNWCPHVCTENLASRPVILLWPNLP